MQAMAGAVPPERGTPPATPAGLVERLRAVHLKMVEAVLGGEGLGTVAALAADAVGAPVVICVPRLGISAASPDAPAAPVDDVTHYVTDRIRDRPAQVPGTLSHEVPIQSGDELVGAVVLLAGRDPDIPDATEFLHLAAVASLTEVAIEEAREEVEQNLRGSFLEDLRSRPDLEPREIVRRAGRLGCDLSRGAVVLCAELTTDRPRHVVATISGEYPGALAQHMEGGGPGAAPAGRVYALLPATGADELACASRRPARRLAEKRSSSRSRIGGFIGLSLWSSPTRP